MSNASSATNATANTSLDMGFSYAARFWLDLIPNILSVFCAIFVLYHLLCKRTLRQALSNHVIIIIIIISLITELTDVLWVIHYYHFGYTWQQTPSFVLIWKYIDFVSWVSQTMLFAWGTIERHILVFNDRWVSTRKKRILVHYLPVTSILIYSLGYFAIIFLATTCHNNFDYTQLYGLPSPCILNNPVLPKWGLIFNQIIPTFIIILFSLGLIGRVLFQKRRLHRSINWRKQRKMIIQLLSITIIYLVFNVPYRLIGFAYFLGLPRTVWTGFTLYTTFFKYYIPFLIPFVACGTLPKLGIKLKRLFCCHRQQQPQIVHPAFNLTVRGKQTACVWSGSVIANNKLSKCKE